MYSIVWPRIGQSMVTTILKPTVNYDYTHDSIVWDELIPLYM